MRTWMVRAVFLAVIMAIGFWAWNYFFPSPERVIRKRLIELARSASFGGREGEVAKFYNAALFGSFFTDDVEVSVDVAGQRPFRFSGRDQLTLAAQAARATAGSLLIEFPDIKVTVGPDKNLASASVTAKAKLGIEKDIIVQELKFMLKKVGREWLIYQVETVKTLSSSEEKLQASTSKFQGSSNDPAIFQPWSLEFGASLEFGC